MKKIAAVSLAAAMATLPVSGASAQDITPVNPSMTTGAIAGGLGIGGLAVGSLLIAVIVASASNPTSGTN